MSDRRAAAIGLVALVATGCAVALVALSDHDTSKVATIALAVPVGLAFIAIGIVAARRRPENRTGLLMIATGFAWFAGALPESNNALLFSIGNLLGAASFGFLIHLVLAFPSGRLVGRGVRALAIGGYLLVGLANLGFMLVDDLKDDCVDCPRNVLLVSDVSAISDTIRALTAIGAAILAGGVVTVLVRRWRAATPAMRRALTPVFTAGGITLLLAALLVVAQAAADALAPTFYWLLLVSLITVPLAFLAGLLRARLATAAVGRLLAETPETPTRAEAQESLRRALRDPTLELAFWLPERRAYVDPGGRPFVVAEGDPRASTPIAVDGEPLALVVHDAALSEEPEVLTGVLAAAKLALQKDRLQAQLRAQVDELQRERDFVATVVNSAPAFFCVLDSTGRIERFNATLEEMSGRPDDDAVRGLAFWNVFPVPEAADEARSVIEGHGPGAEHEWRAADGGTRVISWRLTPLPEGRLLASGSDVTERKRVLDEQAALRRVATLVAEDPEPSTVLGAVTREVGLLFGGDSAAIFRYGDGRSFTVMGGWSAGGDVVEAGTERFLDGDTAAALVQRTEVPARIDDYREVDGEFARDLERRGIRCTIAAPVIVGGAVWGAVSVSSRQLNRFAPDAENRLASFAGLVAQAIANAEARRELRSAAARIVEAGDAARKRLERNLHDGAQQRLVAISLILRLAQNRLPEDVGGASEILAGASEELTLALEELRELARGLHPAILSDRGLVPALSALAVRSTIPVKLDIQAEERLPEGVEVALFYVASEPLTNVVKYAQASAVKIRLAMVGEDAVIEIEDDGVGGADARGGSGIRGLRDRIESLDGRLDVYSDPGVGTVVRAAVPVVRVPEPVAAA